ncbi:MAG TPA: trypsin-like peptidase domain-containing protein [Solirubrobacterales bacterium]|nr:trypsin-like peptidase domain-containing protein [Solirubrobacterales bacterium]
MSGRTRSIAAALAAAGLIALAGCGGDDDDGNADSGGGTTTTEQVIVQAANGDFNAAEIYEKASPAVVTIISIFGESADPLQGGAGQGSGFVVTDDGEIVTNAHVVTTGGQGNGGGQPKEASQVYVELSDRNRVPADILGVDPDADVALIKIDPAGLDLHHLNVSEREEYAVGEPVAAIGSPFGERQSLSTGIVSAVDRSIQSLTAFSIDNAIQTDASINPGNSGGPLLDGKGEVIGVNQQIETASGSNSGVGFAIPATAVLFSLDQLRENGEVDYAYLGVSTQGVYPQLAEEFDLGSETGALISDVVEGGPADDAGLEGSDREETFQGVPVSLGGDVIVAVDGTKLQRESDLAELVSRQRPGKKVTLEIIRDGDRREVEVELEPRPARVAQSG